MPCHLLPISHKRAALELAPQDMAYLPMTIEPTSSSGGRSFASAKPGDCWTSRQTWTALALVMLAWAIAAAIWPLTGTVVPWDSKNHFYPMLRYLGAALANGELPLWNPYHFSGHPSVADPQSLLFTPTMLLFAWLDSSPSMQLFDLVIFAHFLPGALAIVALFRKRCWYAAGAVVAALIFILGGSASARLQHTGMIFSYGFFPLAFWLLEEALDRRSYLFGVAFAIIAAMMTVGRDQVAFLCALTLIGAAVYQLLTAQGRPAYLRSRLPLLLFMGVVGGFLLAVPTVLTMQLLATSTRPSFGYGVAAMGSLPPSSLATIFFSNIFGSLRWSYDYWGPDWKSLAEATWTDRAVNYLFIGTIPGLLILWHGIAAGRLLSKEFRFFLIIGVIAIVYALGHYTPIFVRVFDHFPAVDLYRRPADATFLLNFFLAFAAGYLVHRYLKDGAPSLTGWWRSPRRALGFAVASTFLTVLLVQALRMSASAHHLIDALQNVAFGVAVASMAITLVLFRGTPRARHVAAIAIVAITGGELIWRNAASSLNAEPAERYAVFQKLPPEQLQGLQLLRQELAERHKKGERPRVEILGLGGAWQNASMVLGFEDTIGYNPLRLANYERAIGPGENAADPNLRQFPSSFRGYRCELASLLGLEYLVLDRPAEKLPSHFPRLENAKLLYGSGHMWIYRLSAPTPRAYLAEIIVPVDSDAALDQDDMPEFDRKKEALIDEGSMDQLHGTYTRNAGEPVLSPKPTNNNSVRITNYQPNSVTLDVTSTNGGVLVLHDIFYPGWEVSVDGKTRPVLRANLLFRGVEVPVGRHKVEFRFRPLSIDNLVAAASDLVESKLDEATDGEAR